MAGALPGASIDRFQHRNSMLSTQLFISFALTVDYRPFGPISFPARSSRASICLAFVSLQDKLGSPQVYHVPIPSAAASYPLNTTSHFTNITNRTALHCTAQHNAAPENRPGWDAILATTHPALKTNSSNSDVDDVSTRSNGFMFSAITCASMSALCYLHKHAHNVPGG
jgi:hypothetical protein